MRSFRCYLMDNAEHVVSVFSIEAEDDANAMWLAGDLRRTKYCKNAGIDVWDQARYVGRIADLPF